MAKLAKLAPEVYVYHYPLRALTDYGGYREGDWDNPPEGGDRDTFYVFAYDWRRDNVDRFVERMYDAVHRAKPWVKVGVSPFCILRPGNPPQIKGLDAYDAIYADIALPDGTDVTGYLIHPALLDAGLHPSRLFPSADGADGAPRLPSAWTGVSVLATRISASAGPGSQPVAVASRAAFDDAGLGPDDLDLLELHDAAAPAEILQYAEIGLCAPGEGHLLVRSGATALGGKLPVNLSEWPG